MLRLLGGGLIVAGSMGLGILAAKNERAREETLRELLYILRWMNQDLQRCRTPLPQLLKNGAEETKGQLQFLLQFLSAELERQAFPDVASCMEKALEEYPPDPILHPFLRSLGRCLGQFDLEGQVRELELIHEDCARALEQIIGNKTDKLHLIRTLGICGGIILVILLF